MKNDIFFGLFLFLLVLLFKIPVLNLPLFGDEMHFVSGSLGILKNHLNPFVEFWGYKPPFLFFTTAIVYQLFGFSIIATRLVIVFFAALALFFTYLLGKELFDRKTGILASLLLFISPLFFMQSGLFHVAISTDTDTRC